MKAKEIELIDDGKQGERFQEMTKKLLTVSKVDLDKRLEAERQSKKKRVPKKV